MALKRWFVIEMTAVDSCRFLSHPRLYVYEYNRGYCEEVASAVNRNQRRRISQRNSVVVIEIQVILYTYLN